MRYVLLDTNVVLDVLYDRAPWVAEARSIWQAVDDGRILAYLAATTLTNIFYVGRQLSGLQSAHEAVQTCLEAFEICTIDRPTLERALGLSGSDFEDNVQIACAVSYGVDAIITRDAKGFKDSPVPVLTPIQALDEI
ncbi:MAG: PIN domain-containing protein [Chloroflexi bacterium]|nr:PIN domain-containing protein [Chloroflexota bacterium]